MAQHKYSWIPDLPDRRDLRFPKTKCLRAIQLPDKVDLRSSMPSVYDQGYLGSCTANAIAACSEFLCKKNGIKSSTPSRLYIYFNTRRIEGSVDRDAGAMLRDGMKALATWGACPEKMWPYKIAKFSEVPDDACFTEAFKHTALEYRSIEIDEMDMKTVLASGYPFVIGFSIYDSFESKAVALNGKVPIPGDDERLLGGHAVCVVGYNDKTQTFIVRNSWGNKWGDWGYCHIPYDYLTNPFLAADAWVLTAEK